jgi:hypothetical protein
MSAAPRFLGPLAESFAYDEIEADLKAIFMAMVNLMIDRLADENALGMAHLGSDELIIRAMTADGLTLPTKGFPYAYSYLYRAWKGRNSGRGLHFLKTCLQLLWPNRWEARQLAQDKGMPYPYALSPAEEEDDGGKFLTSRIRVALETSHENWMALGPLDKIFRAVVPARIVLMYALVNVINANHWTDVIPTISHDDSLSPIPLRADIFIQSDVRARLSYKTTPKKAERADATRQASATPTGRMKRHPSKFSKTILGKREAAAFWWSKNGAAVLPPSVAPILRGNGKTAPAVGLDRLDLDAMPTGLAWFANLAADRKEGVRLDIAATPFAGFLADNRRALLPPSVAPILRGAPGLKADSATLDAAAPAFAWVANVNAGKAGSAALGLDTVTLLDLAALGRVKKDAELSLAGELTARPSRMTELFFHNRRALLPPSVAPILRGAPGLKADSATLDAAAPAIAWIGRAATKKPAQARLGLTSATRLSALPFSISCTALWSDTP